MLGERGTVDVRFSEAMVVDDSFKPFSFRLSVAYAVEGGTAFVDLGVVDELGFDTLTPCSLGDAGGTFERHAPFSVASVETPGADRFELIPSYAPQDEDLPICQAFDAYREMGGDPRFVLHYRQLTGAAPLQSDEGVRLDELGRFWPANGTNCDVQPIDLETLEPQVQIEDCPFLP